MRPLAAFRQELPYRELAPLALRLAGRVPGVAFLDAGGPDIAGSGRWAVLGWRPARTLAFPAGRRGAVEAIRALLGEPRMEPDLETPAPFRGGWIGWIGYDVGRDIERMPDRNPPSPGVPEFVLAEYEGLLVEDRRDRRLFLTGGCDRHEGPSRLLARQIEAIEHFAEIDRGAADPEFGDTRAAPDIRPVTPRDEYLGQVERVLAWIRAGDIFQANLSHRFEGRLDVPVGECYRRLRAASPAPYGCLLDLAGPAVLSVSPELFLERRGTRLSTRPIKGTRRRGADPAADVRLRDELERSEKDRAELAMIVDLLRNDLGRVAATGTVRVERERELITHPTLHHASAVISAEAPRSVHAADIVRATMPGGSVTGAPKIRAMEILEELESGRRGPYCGAAGWFGYDGDFVLNILIRTVVVERGADGSGRASFRVGGGIVADSDPQAEHDETLVKAAALLRALGAGSP